MSVLNKIFNSKSNNDLTCTAVIVAAGNSQRMGTDKILLPLGGKPVIAHTLSVFQRSPLIDEIVVVTKHENIVAIADICHEYGFNKVSVVTEGGITRAHSALNGVLLASESSRLIAVHDGARPFVTEELIERVISAAADSGAAVPAVKPTDTVRILNAKGAVADTPDRNRVALVQTPQIFDAELISRALIKVIAKDIAITDDASAVEAAGGRVSVVSGDSCNIKLTTPTDIYLAEKILSEKGTDL